MHSVASHLRYCLHLQEIFILVDFLCYLTNAVATADLMIIVIVLLYALIFAVY